MSVAKKENIIVATYFAFTLLMTNPPVVNWISKYAESNPLVMGWPTVWVWLQFWYMAMIGGLIYFGLKFKSWNVDYIEESFEQHIEGGK